MSDILRQKLSQLEAKRAELDRFRGRLSEAQRLVAQESDRMVTLMGQLSTLLKRETWNTMASGRAGPPRPGMPGRPPQPPAMSQTLVNQATAAVDAAIKQADAMHARLATVVRELGGEPPAAFRSAAAEEEELAIDVEPARVAEVVSPPPPPKPAAYAGPSASAWSQAHPAAVPMVAPPPIPVPPPVVAPVPVVAPPVAESHEPAPHAEHHEKPPATCPAADAGQLDVDDEKAVMQAVETGRKALENLDHSMEAAREATHGGLLRTAAGMVRGGSPTRAKLGEARAAARAAAEDLRLLHRQTKELRHRLGEHHLGAAPLGAMADQLAEAAAEEAPEAADLTETVSQTRQTYHEVRSLCSRLQLAAAAIRSHKAAMNRGRPKMAVK